MSRLRRVALMLAAFLYPASQTIAGDLRKLWEVDLRAVVAATMPALPVFALRFSPDGRKLAVIADAYGSGEQLKSRLLVQDLDHPDAKVREFEVDFGILENENGRSYLEFGWTPNSQIIYALGKVVHIESGMTCELPNSSVFIDDDVAVSTRGVPPAGVISSTQITFFNANCEEKGKWSVPESWLMYDVATARHLVSVIRDRGPGPGGEGLIVDPLNRRVVRRWVWDDSPGGAWEFADDGKMVCHGGPLLGSDRAPATCRDVDSWRVIGETKSNGTDPIATASHARRAVVSDYRRHRIPFSSEYDATLRGRLVWDFGTGQELANWVPAYETYPSIFTPSKQIKERFRFAMSPDGRRVAEGGNGIIRLYKIEP